MTTNPTQAAIIHAYVNGWLSTSATRSALKAIGLSAEQAQACVHLAWYGISPPKEG